MDLSGWLIAGDTEERLVSFYTLRTDTVVTVQELARGLNIKVRHFLFTWAIT